MAPMAVKEVPEVVEEVVIPVEEPLRQGFFKRLWNRVKKIFRK